MVPRCQEAAPTCFSQAWCSVFTNFPFACSEAQHLARSLLHGTLEGTSEEVKAGEGPCARTERHRGPSRSRADGPLRATMRPPAGTVGFRVLHSQARPAGEDCDPLQQRVTRGEGAPPPSGLEARETHPRETVLQRTWRSGNGSQSHVSLGFPGCERRAAKCSTSVPVQPQRPSASARPPPQLPGCTAGCVGSLGTTSEARRREQAHPQLLRPGRPK